MNFCVIMFIAHSSVGVFPLGASSIVVRENVPGVRERIRFHETTRTRNFKKEFPEKSYLAPWHAVAHEAIKNSHRVISPTTTPTISPTPHHSTGATNAASKASPNIATRSKKPPINLRILNFSDSSKAIGGWGDISGFVVTTGNMLSLTTDPPSSLSEASFVRLSTPITSPSSSSSASSSSASSSSSRLSKLCNKLTLDSQPFFNASHNKRTSCRVSESNLSEIIGGSFHAFHAFQRHFLAPNKNGKFEFINNNGRRPPRRLHAFSEMGRNHDVSSHGFREPKTLKKGKRDYLVRRKNHKLVSREKTTKENRRSAWMEGTKKANILRRVRRIRSIESNLKKSIQNDVLYEDYDGNDQERINTEEITTNNRYVDSSQTSSTPILESSDLKVFSISLNISEDYIDLKFKNDNETTQILDETQDDDSDDPITFWSLPKDLKNLASKRKPQIFRNLTILPLGMLLIFLVLVILQVSRWCLEDIRESDGPHLNYTYHLSILGGRDYSMYNKSITSRSLCDANIYEVPTKPKQNIYGRNGARKQKHLSRYLLRGNSAPNGASDGLAYGCRGVVELMMKSSAGMLSNRSLASYDCPFVNAEQYSCSAPRLSETPRGSQQTLELSYLHGRKLKAAVAQTGDKKLSGNKKHNKRVSRSLNNFKSEPRLTSNPQQVHHRSRLSTLKKGSSTESASNSSLASLTQQQQQKKKQQKRWQRQNHPKRQSSNTSNISENSYYGQTLGSLLVMPSRLVVAPMAVASPSATVSTLLSSNSSSAAIPPPVFTIAKETDDIRTRHHSSPASSNSIKAFNSVHHDNNLTKASTAVVKRFQKQHCLEFDLKEGDSTNKLLESDCESLDVELHGERNIIKEDGLKPAICRHLQDFVEPVNDESSANNCPIRAVQGGNLKLEDHNADMAENNYPSTKRKIPTSASDSSSVGKAENSSCLEEASTPRAFYSYKSSPRRSITMAGESSVGY